MDASIVIVNWKVRDLLRRALASVYRETKGASFEVLVVDNDSRDGSVEMVAREFPQATLIANNRNAGFAAACNSAIERASGEFVLLLNPDSELKEDAVSAMVAHMRAHPEIGILGPRITNADGSTQASVSRFPTFWSQAIVMLKLHNVAAWFPSLRRLFAVDVDAGFDYSRAQQVDQVKGAAFMIRRSAMEKIGLLDATRFFIWYEEVDWCKRAKDAGLEVWYAPVANVAHHGGASFGQVFGPSRQRMLNTSMRRYVRKHLGLAAYLGLLALHPISMLLAYVAVPLKNARYAAASGEHAAASGQRGAHEARAAGEAGSGAASGNASTGGSFFQPYRKALLYFMLFELISLYGFLIPWVSTTAFFAIVGATLVLAWRRPDLAILILFAELFVGSQGGYMVAYAGDGLFVSLRLGLFVAVFAIWLAKTVLGFVRAGVSHPALQWFVELRARKLFWPYVAIIAVIGYGALRGLALKNSFGEVFFDANGYAFFALLPAVIAAFVGTRGRTLPLRILATLCAAVTVSVAKALTVLFFFSHRQFFFAWNLYVWVRDTRVGEITIMVADFYRIFFQSQIWALALLFAGTLYAVYAPSWRDRRVRGALALISWAMVSMVLSLSRSFWFGGAVAALLFAAVLVYARAGIRVWRNVIGIGIGSLLAAVAIIFVVYSFPYPNKTGDLSFADLLSSRATSLNDAAASSRWKLLPKLVEAGMQHPILGSGLGRTVTYTTSDPRLLADNPTGAYTTSAFEWGYHDLWVKFGLFGIAAYAWLVIRLLAPFARAIREERSCFGTPRSVIAGSVILAVIALLATHLFSPYLNHPLGIGMLMLAAAFLPLVINKEDLKKF